MFHPGVFPKALACFIGLAVAGLPVPEESGQWYSAASDSPVPHEELLGSSLVRVGSHHGLLVSKNGVQAVHGRRDDLPTQPELLRAIKSAHQARAGLRAPCPPATAGSPSCRSWCRRIVPDRPVEGRLEGSCLRKEGNDGPRCLCQEEAETLASCLMHCEATEDVVAPPPSVPAPKTGASVKASKADALTEPRYLLYDTRYHVGFMAQVEVFFVALELVSQLNRRLNTACKDAGGHGCQPWTLVLPPWCWVPRWYHADASRGRPWSDLFNLEGLKAEVAVRDYASLGNSAVDVGVVLVPGGRTSQLKDGHGDFLGFTKDMQACESHGQQVPQAGRQRNAVVYSGYCDEDLAVKNLRCGVVRESSLKGLVDLAENVKGRSLLIKHLDALRLHRPEGGLVLKFHHMLAPAPALVTAAKKFADLVLGPLPYLGVHIRRNDFVVTHAVTTPSATAAASRINRLLKKRQLEQVFVAGDADEGFRADLRSGVKVALYFFSQDDGAELPELRGQEELVELQLASQAEYFIGSAGSAFSAAVRRHRQRLGHPPSTSDEVFCANLTAETSRKRCAAE